MMFGRRGAPHPQQVTPADDVQSSIQDVVMPKMAADVVFLQPAPNRDDELANLADKLLDETIKTLSPLEALEMDRNAVAGIIQSVIVQHDDCQDIVDHEVRDLVTYVLNKVLDRGRQMLARATAPSLSILEKAKEAVLPLLMDRLDVSKANDVPRDVLAQQVTEIVAEILGEERIRLNLLEQRQVVTLILNDMLGLGPLEPLLADETVNDIMVNGAKQVYVERKGKLELTDVTFRDDNHLMNIASRIVSQVGRRVDESTPLVDARLMDGSRVNIIIPPLAIDGPSISIRKFSKKKITLDIMEKQGNMSPGMATTLRIASRSRLNILICGGTGSGKTTLLNALSRMIDESERIVTIEDAAELQLQQPHVVRLETRPENLEGRGEITQRELVKNALRMRPDRIILGEIRAGEALDMLQAMNTGHDGSLGTIHANNPREGLTRLENMVAMTGVKLPHEAVRAQIASAIDMIVQVSRMRDGMRRITYITEIVGMEGEVITTQDLFTYSYEGEDNQGRLLGQFNSSKLRPAFYDKAKYFGLERALMEAMGAMDQEGGRAK